MPNAPEIRVPTLLAQGCFTFCVDDKTPDEPFVSGGAFCPEPLHLTTPPQADVGLSLLVGGAFDATAVVHADAGAVRFYYLFNLMDSQTRRLLAASANRKRFDLRVGSMLAPVLPTRCVSLDLPFGDVLKHTEEIAREPFERWVDSIHGVVPGMLKLWDMHFKSPSTADTYHCPVIMVPPWQVSLQLTHRH